MTLEQIKLVYPKALLFDWDETLCDSKEHILKALNATFKAFNYPLWTLRDFKDAGGRSRADLFPELFGENFEKAMTLFEEAYESFPFKGGEVLEGFYSFIKYLNEKELYLAIISNKPAPYLKKEVKESGLLPYFSKIIGSGEAKKDKPSVEIVLQALEGSGINPGPHVWIVGDMAADVMCARLTGCTAVLVEKQDNFDGKNLGFSADLKINTCIQFKKTLQILEST